jgi:hypothetical protein
MMKKILIFAVVLSLLAPAAALADTEFSLGGFIKLDSYWDSTQNGKNMNGVPARNNDTAYHHGNLRFTAQGSRINFTIKGPEVLGAKLTGFIEMDFDSCTDVGSISNSPGSQSASNNYVPRMRHAMFRLNWPGETELMFGQYWSMFCDWFIESAEDGPFQLTGTPTARIPQIRFTQGFLGDWHAAGLVGLANGYGEFSYSSNANTSVGAATNPYNTSTTPGADAEVPQIQGQLKYAHDWWGQAAYYGHPTPFTASVTAGWQRYVQRNGSVTVGTLDAPNVSSNNLNGTPIAAYMPHTYFSPWMVQGALFIPVIPTHSANLAGTAHLLIQPWVGQGVNQFGMTGDSTGVFKLAGGTSIKNALVDEELVKRWGGLVEGQYWFTNQWFINAAYGYTGVFGIDQSNINVPGVGTVQQYAYNQPFSQMRSIQQVDATLWYRPIAALKFGLQYSYVHTQFLEDAYPGIGGNPASFATSGSLTNKADEHRVEFVGFFYF